MPKGAPEMTQNNPLFPPYGALRAVVEFIYGQAPYPIPEVALAAGLGLFAGITGRAYQTPDPMAGLNLYVMCVAATGKGKDAGQVGIHRLINAVVQGKGDGMLPELAAAKGFVGPSRFVSEPALLRHAATLSNSFVSIMPEGGKEIRRMTDPKASQHDRDVSNLWLKLYGSSAHGSVYSGSSYADNRNNIPDIQAPALSIYAEGTPSTVFANVTEDTMADGLIPRFLILESVGAWPELNRTPRYQPPEDLTAWLASLCERALRLNQRNEVVQVQIAPEAAALLESFRVELRRTMERADEDVAGSLWSRSHLRAMKLASLVAVGVNFDVPTITHDLAVWAINLEVHATNGVSKRVDSGEVGGKDNDEAKQAVELIRTVYRYVATEYHKLPKLRVPRTMHEEKVVPLSYLQQDLLQKKAFKDDRAGANAALKRTIQSFLDAGDLQEISRTQLAEKFNKTGRAFVITNPARFIGE